MTDDITIIQSQLDDIKGAIFVIVDRLANLSNRLDSSVSDLERLSKSMAASQKPPAPQVDAYYPQVQERLAAIAAIEREMLESMRANAEMVRLVGDAQAAMRRREDELAGALKLVAGHLAEISAKIDSQSNSPKNPANLPQSSMVVADATAPQVATALTMMAHKLDLHLAQQAHQHDAIADMVASIVESTTVRQNLEASAVAVQEDAIPEPPRPPQSQEPVVETATISDSAQPAVESEIPPESQGNPTGQAESTSTEISFAGNSRTPLAEELPEPPHPRDERERRIYKSKLPWE